MFFDYAIPDELDGLELPSLNPENAELSIREAERYLDFEPKYVPMTYYMDYRREGDRVKYETPYHEKRFALGALLIGELQEGKGRFLDKIIDVLYSILQETTWCFAAHNLYKRDTKTYMLPNTRRPVIDLFSAETSASLAVAYAALKPILKDPEYDALFNLIEDEIEDRIIIPYLNDSFWWMGGIDSFTNNWTPWCTMNMILTFFLLPVDGVRRRKALRQACYSLDHFLENYGKDGCCNEGATYYHHAGLSLMTGLRLMNEITRGGFEFAFEDERIRNIASFISNMHVKGDWYINYADGSAKPGRSGIREFLAGMDTHNDELMNFARCEYDESSVRGRYYMDEWNIYARFLAHSYDGLISSYEKKDLLRKDVYYPSNGVVVAERGRYVFAIKGGDNGDSHNHNDVGSIILYKDGEPLLIDIGVEEYTALTFSERRYEIWTMRSIYHNTLNFGDIEEKAGKEYSSRNMKVYFGNDVSVSMNIEKAFDDERVPSYNRRVMLGEDGITVFETAETSLPRVLTLMTRDLVQAEDDKLTIGKNAVVEFSIPMEKVETESFQIDDTKLNAAWGKGSFIYRTRIYFEEDFSWSVR